MNKSKKIAVTVGAITSVAVPAIVATTTIKINDNDLSNKNNKVSTLQGDYNGYTQEVVVNQSSQTSQIQDAAPATLLLDEHISLKGGFTQTIKGTTYIGTLKNGLHKWAGRGRTKQIAKQDVSYGFIRMLGSTIYVGSSDGLFKLVNDKLVKVNSDNYAHAVVKKVKGTTYVGNSKGLHEFNENTGKLTLIDSIDMRDGFIETIDNTIYLGTYGKGLKKLEKRKVVDAAKKANGKTDDRGISFIKEIDGKIYAGASAVGNDQGLLLFKNGTFTQIDKTFDLSNAFIKEINGVIFVGTRKGIKTLSKGKLRTGAKNNNGIDNIDTTDGFIEEIGGHVMVGRENGISKLDFSAVRMENESFIHEWFNQVKVANQGLKTVDEIANEIKDSKSLKKYLENSSTLNLNFSKIINVSAFADGKTGQIDVTFDVETPFAFDVSSFDFTIYGDSDEIIKDKISNLKKKKSIKVNKDLSTQDDTPKKQTLKLIMIVLTSFAGATMLATALSALLKSIRK